MSCKLSHRFALYRGKAIVVPWDGKNHKAFQTAESLRVLSCRLQNNIRCHRNKEAEVNVKPFLPSYHVSSCRGRGQFSNYSLSSSPSSSSSSSLLHGPFSLALASLRITVHSSVSWAFSLHLFILRFLCQPLRHLTISAWVFRHHDCLITNIIVPLLPLPSFCHFLGASVKIPKQKVKWTLTPAAPGWN
jgi:hypothetical protein